MNICLYCFIALSIEADAAVDRAFSSANSDEILSEAFRLQVAGKDLATLKFQNWLNDEVSILWPKATKQPQDIPLLFLSQLFSSLTTRRERREMKSSLKIFLPEHLDVCISDCKLLPGINNGA